MEYKDIKIGTQIKFNSFGSPIPQYGNCISVDKNGADFLVPGGGLLIKEEEFDETIDNFNVEIINEGDVGFNNDPMNKITDFFFGSMNKMSDDIEAGTISESEGEEKFLNMLGGMFGDTFLNTIHESNKYNDELEELKGKEIEEIKNNLPPRSSIISTKDYSNSKNVFMIKLIDYDNDIEYKAVDEETWDWVMSNDMGRLNDKLRRWDDRACPDTLRERILENNKRLNPYSIDDITDEVFITSGSWSNDRALLAPYLNDSEEQCSMYNPTTKDIIKFYNKLEKMGFVISDEEFSGNIY